MGLTLSTKNVLVTGAGCLGSAMVRRLRAEGAAVKVVDLSEERLAPLDHGVSRIVADITDGPAMKEAAAGTDLVIHTAAVLEGDADVMRRVNVAGTRCVVEAAAAARVERVVHISSVAVYGISKTTDITEAMGPDPSEQVYSITKSLGEEEVHRIGSANGLSYTIIRPAAIFGPGAQYFTAQYFRRGQRKPVIFLGRGNGALPVVFVDDVVDLAMVLAEHPAADGEVFNCAIDPPPTHREYLMAYAQLSGHQRYFGFPMALAKFGAFVAAPFAKKGTYVRELAKNLSHIGRYVRIDTSRARDLIGWEPRYDVEAGIEASMPWLKERGLLGGNGGGAGPG